LNHLHVDSIQKQFVGRHILTDIFLNCSTGDVVGLLGRNGTGKSTLMKIIAFALKADFRHVSINGKALLNTADNRQLISYLPQEQFIPGHIKIKSAFQIYCHPSKLNTIYNDRFIKPLLHRKTHALSGGELRYLEIMLLLYSESQFCLLDEPFKGIAPLYKEKIADLIIQNATEKGIIISDHDYKNVMKVTNKNYILNDGGTYEVKNEEDLRDWKYIR